MATYILLINWTDLGIRNVGETIQGADQARQMIEQMGGRLATVFWTQGRYDLVAIIEAPDDETVAAIGLRVSMNGGTRTETLRAFDAEEMGRILGRLG